MASGVLNINRSEESNLENFGSRSQYDEDSYINLLSFLTTV
jgi:hypothetical protein